VTAARSTERPTSVEQRRGILRRRTIGPSLTVDVCGVPSRAARQTPGIPKGNHVDAILNASDI
jgi:hypothetical protein